ncbi:MAG: PH domain-containing protein [Flavobacterium sp.]|jgi:hypothetical protein|nr:PH domain-containing protein [Flavobacterium sp.]
MTYKATLDNLAKIVTIICTILFSIIIASMIWQCKGEIELTYIAIIALLLFTYILSYSFSPKNYSITDENLIVNRLFSNKEIKLSSIQKVQELNNDELKWSLRTFGVGGLFGYFGKFWVSKLGSMIWYATKRNNAVLIETGSKKIIVTPDEQEKFVNELKSKIAK